MQLGNSKFKIAGGKLRAQAWIAACRLSLIFALLLLAPLYPAQANHHPVLVQSGTAAVPPAVIQSVIRSTLAHKLNAQILGERIQFETPEIRQQITLPAQNQTLLDSLKQLGIDRSLEVVISPLKIVAKIPNNNLRIQLQQTSQQTFEITAQWRLQEISAQSEQLRILVPKGIFDVPFEISTNSLRLGLAKKSPSIRIQLKLRMTLTPQGSKFSLVQLNTNLDEARPQAAPEFDFGLSPLLVNGSPLQLQIESQGKIIEARESEIREQLETLAPSFSALLKKELETQIQREFSTFAKKLEAEDPVKLKLSTQQLLSRSTVSKPVKDLLSGISGDFQFSKLEYNPQQALFLAQVASHLCLNSQCLLNTRVSPVRTEDLEPIANRKHELGLLIYESWIQRMAHDPAIQDRIQEYYETQAKAPGVDIGTSGVRVHVNGQRKTIDAVFNLAIDIKKTALSKNANTALKKFMDRSKKRIGDAWENAFGTGKLVLIPIEIQFELQGIVRNPDNDRLELQIKSRLPFQKDGAIINTYQYPSNVDRLTQMVRSDFMSAIEKTFEDVVPSTIRIPLPREWKADGVTLEPSRAVITPNAGILITAKVIESHQRGTP